MTESAGTDADGLSVLGDSAMAQVDALAATAGVRLVPVTTAAGHHEVAGVFSTVWDAPPAAGPVRAGTMRAAQHVGAYVMGIHPVDDEPTGVLAVGEGNDVDAGPMVGASFAFHGADGHLHSHVTGVLADWQGRGLGLVTKLHQRAWCLQRGIDRVTWTFDPLVQRNARFNLQRLGAGLEEYLPSFYGPMTDGINAGDDTDRAFVVWHLDSPAVARAVAEACRRRLDPAGSLQRHGRDREPGTDAVAAATAGNDHGVVAIVTNEDDRPRTEAAPVGTSTVAVATPRDIEALRRLDPDLALQWRHAVREAMHPRLEAGWRVVGMSGEGSYLMEAP
ncbi:MAG TPA: hypothetical protein VJ978_02285 [Nitriliruptoraceae bacterium]|nr:hypothetical protein [Nitriliruptoraceae bacterium]